MQNKTTSISLAAGWGLTIESDKSSQSPVLLQLQVPVVDNKDCRNYYKKIGDAALPIQFGERILCAGIHRGIKNIRFLFQFKNDKLNFVNIFY